MSRPSTVGRDPVFEKEQVHDFDFNFRSLAGPKDLE